MIISDITNALKGKRRLEHFGIVTRRYIRELAKSLNPVPPVLVIGKNSDPRFALRIAQDYPEGVIDYCEFSSTGELGSVTFIQPDTREYVAPSAPEMAKYLLAVRFLAWHDIGYDPSSGGPRPEQDLVALDKKVLETVISGGLFIDGDYAYNQGSWIHRKSNPRRTFGKSFTVTLEKRAVNKEGEEECFKRHTWTSLDLSARTMINAGASLVRTELSPRLVEPKFYLAIGRKNK